MKSFATLFLAFVFSLNVLADTVSDKEKDVLIKLYHSTNGSQWKVKWDLSSSVSTWYGVQTYNGKVTALHLADNNLQGELPGAFFDLVNLVVLDLHKNHLKGALSNEIEKLNQLEILCLSDNEIEGILPNSLYKLAALKVLLLNNNKFSGNLSSEIVNLNSLQNLSLFDNNFEGEIPKELESLSNLSELNLSYNKFKGSVSRNLTVLDSLNMTMFDSHGNPFLLDVNEERKNENITVN